MILAVAANNGGVGKSTTAIHLAAVLGRDATANTVAEYRPKGHVVVDTPAAPTREELEAFATRSDLVIVPSTPNALALDLLIDTVRDLRWIDAPSESFSRPSRHSQAGRERTLGTYSQRRAFPRSGRRSRGPPRLTTPLLLAP